MVTVMNKKYYADIINYIDELIGEHNQDFSIESIEDLSEDEFNHLAFLFLEYYDRDTQECFQNSNQYRKDDDITCALIGVLRNDSRDNRNELCDLILRQTKNSFRNEIKELISQRIEYLNSYQQAS